MSMRERGPRGPFLSWAWPGRVLAQEGGARPGLCWRAAGVSSWRALHGGAACWPALASTRQSHRARCMHIRHGYKSGAVEVYGRRFPDTALPQTAAAAPCTHPCGHLHLLRVLPTSTLPPPLPPSLPPSLAASLPPTAIPGDEDEQDALLAGMMSPPSGYSSGAEGAEAGAGGSAAAGETLAAVRQRIEGAGGAGGGKVSRKGTGASDAAAGAAANGASSREWGSVSSILARSFSCLNRLGICQVFWHGNS